MLKSDKEIIHNWLIPEQEFVPKLCRGTDKDKRKYLAAICDINVVEPAVIAFILIKRGLDISFFKQGDQKMAIKLADHEEEIMAGVRNGETLTSLAQRYRVSISTISYLVSRYRKMHGGDMSPDVLIEQKKDEILGKYKNGTKISGLAIEYGIKAAIMRTFIKENAGEEEARVIDVEPASEEPVAPASALKDAILPTPVQAERQARAFIKKKPVILVGSSAKEGSRTAQESGNPETEDVPAKKPMTDVSQDPAGDGNMPLFDLPGESSHCRNSAPKQHISGTTNDTKKKTPSGIEAAVPVMEGAGVEEQTLVPASLSTDALTNTEILSFAKSCYAALQASNTALEEAMKLIEKLCQAS